MQKLYVILLTFALYITAGSLAKAWAGEQIVIDGPSLFVTHASRRFDSQESTRLGLERALARAQLAGATTVFLTQRELSEHPDWIGKERTPDIAYISRNGAHDMVVRYPRQTFAGGFLSLCQDRTVEHSIESYFNSGDGKLFETTILMDATYEDKFLFGVNMTDPNLDWYFSVDAPLNLQIFYEKLGKTRFIGGILQLLEIINLPYSIELWVKGEKVHTITGNDKKLIYRFE